MPPERLDLGLKSECSPQRAKRRGEETALSKPDVCPLRSRRLHCAKTAWAKMQQCDQCRGVVTHRSAQVGAVAGEPTGQDSSCAMLKVAWQFQKGWTHHINSLLSCGVSHVMNNLIAASTDRKVLFIIHSLPPCLSTCHTKRVRLVAFRPWRWSAPLDRR